MSFLKDNKAQGALEYLLIIGGAILIAAVVIGIIISTGSDATESTDESVTAINNAMDDANTLLEKAKNMGS